jgi:DNA-binding transcriptional regulator GbsR (MarR family)
MSENSIQLRKEQVALIEELAHLHERVGMQPALGKIMALFTVSDELELTFDQVKETLDLSKSAVSQALNQLLAAKKIGYKTKIGDRRRYFFIRFIDCENLMAEKFEELHAMVEMYKKVIDARTPETKEFNQQLKKMVSFLSFVNDEIEELYKKFLKHQKK